ncbi:unnamed protein product, partial [Brassica napus]
WTVPLSSYLYYSHSPLRQRPSSLRFTPELSTRSLISLGVMVVGKSSTTESFSLFLSIEPLALDFNPRKEYLFGKIDMQLKLVPGNSAGTVTAYYLKSKGDTWDEIDFEFLGNLTGDPYVMHTNVYTQGKGDREQQFNLWFDPTADFHTYSVLWNPHHIVFLVDGIAIRQFKNLEHRGIQYPKLQPMRLYSSLWNADQWATRGGLVKTDWSNAPFTASYRNFRADACVSFAGKSSCPASSPRWFTQKLDLTAEDKMRVVQSKFMVYNYCTDTKRFPQGVPKECNIH